jgi:signal transduction histidine kinase
MGSARDSLGRFVTWSNTHPSTTDALFAAVVGAISILGFVTAEATGSQRPQDVLGLILIIGETVAFTARRRAPLRSMIAVVAFTVVFWIADYPSNFDPFSLLAVYAATAHARVDRRIVWRTVGSVVALLTTIAIVGVLVPSEELPAAAVLGIAAIHLTAAIAGETVYDRRRRLSELEDRAVRAEAERELVARQAALDERTRIARDLHDVVAHGMSVMVVQAGAAQRLVANEPDRAAEALEQIQLAGREALTEMRRMLGVLRGEHNEMERMPQPTMDDLDQIIRHCVDSGIPTELMIEGIRPARAVAAEVTSYRIVQEALTNVIRHAGRPARAAVKVTYAPEQIRVEITDDGAGATADELRTNVGHGLIGMRERVDLFHGALHAGPRPGGGFRVSATIPLDRTNGAR